MSRLASIPSRDLERLAAYLDGQLSGKEARAFESRLGAEAALREGLEEMREIVASLRDLGEVRLPRNFTLTQAAAGRRSLPSYPYLRFATALATAVFFLTFGLRLIPTGLTLMAASAPAPEAPMEAQELAAQGATVSGEMAATVAPPTEEMALRAAGPLPSPTAVGTACAECPQPGEVEPPAAAADEIALIPTATESTLQASKAAAYPAGRVLTDAQIALGLTALVLLVFTLRARRGA